MLAFGSMHCRFICKLQLSCQWKFPWKIFESWNETRQPSLNSFLHVGQSLHPFKLKTIYWCISNDCPLNLCHSVYNLVLYHFIQWNEMKICVSNIWSLGHLRTKIGAQITTASPRSLIHWTVLTFASFSYFNLLPLFLSPPYKVKDTAHRRSLCNSVSEGKVQALKSCKMVWKTKI